GGQGLLRTRRAHGLRDRGAGARRDGKRLGLRRSRVPAPCVALLAVVRGRRRAAASAAADASRGNRWTFVTRRRKRNSGRACARGWPRTTPACPLRRPTMSTGLGRRGWPPSPTHLDLF